MEEVAKSFAKAGKIAEGSQTAFFTRLGTQFATLAFNPLLGIKLFLGDAAFGKFIGSRAGQKFLTEGITLSGGVAENVIRQSENIGLGGRILFQASRANER